MKPFSRAQRVSGLIHKTLSDFLRKDVGDPRLESVTITGVKMASDLKTAYIYFSIYKGDKDTRKTAEGFKSARGYVKRNLAGKLGLRYMPELKFLYDESIDYGMKIEALFKSIATEHETTHSTAKK